MNFTKTFTILAVTVAAVAVCQAQLMEIDSVGSFAVTNVGTNLAQSETVVAQVSLGLPGFPTLTTMNLTASSATLTGTATYSDGAGDSFTANLANLDISPVVGNSQAYGGSWTLAAGTGTGYFANKAGLGTFAVDLVYATNTSGFSSTNLGGTLTPEPAALLALGIGIVGIFLKRRS